MLIQPSLYYFLMLGTLCKYGHSIRGVNLILLASWGVEAICTGVISTLQYQGVELNEEILIAWNIFVYANFMLFILLMFRLKSLVIYLDVGEAGKVGSCKDMKLRLRKLNALVIFFGMFLTIFLLSDLDVIIGKENALNQPFFPLYNLIQQAVTLVVFIFVYGYLVKMAFNLQSLFRRNNLVKGYICEICLTVLCILKAVDMFNIEPVIIYLVYRRDFSCSQMLS